MGKSGTRGLCAVYVMLATLHASSLQAKCKPGEALAPGDHVYSLDFEGKTRTFTVHVPPKYNGLTPVGVVFDLHGSYGDGPSQLSSSGFKRASDTNGFIVVAPTGYMNFWNGDIAFGAAYEMMINDVGFMKAVVDYVAGIANINRGKVYSTGLSNGGAMSNTLGCQAADTFAGIAPVSDPLDIGIPTCKPVQPISVLGFHGYSDMFVPYEGGNGSGPMLPTPFPSIPDTLKAWAKIMDCSGTPELTQFTGRSKCEIYRDCGGDAQVGYCSLEGNHGLYSNTALDIADYAWKFFDQHSLPRPDADGDKIGDEDDNCVHIANADQADADGDCIGDACECQAAADCDDGKFCNGAELCSDGACAQGTEPCKSGDSCDESAQRCSDASPGGAVPAAGSGGASVKNEAGSAAGGGAGAAGPRASAKSDSAGARAEAGASAPSSSATAMPGGAAATASRADSATSQSPAAEAKSGCSCTAVGVARGSASWLSSFGLLAVGLAWFCRRRRRHILAE